ncbi:MAG: prolyl oligopeptidase family serine peptidase, partial [Rhodanobacteraceae bacterium]
MSRLRILAGFGFGVLSSVALAQTSPLPHQRVPLIDTQHEVPAMPPPTRKDNVSETFFGTRVDDPYRWLEDADAPAAKQWIAAQNAYTEKVMEGFKDAKAIAKRVGELALTSTQQFDPEIVGHTLFYMRQTPPQPQAELVAQPWPRGTAKVLVSPNGARGSVAITGYWPSPDGKYVAYGTAEGGNEETTLHFVDVATGRTLPDALPHAGGGTTPQALVWDADGRGVTYVRLPLPGTVPQDDLQFDAALYHHELGQAASGDTLEFGKGWSKVAEYTLLGSADGAHAAALVHAGDGDPDVVYLRNENGPWKQVLGTEANVRAASEVNQGAAWDGDRLLVIAYQDAPGGKLLALDADGQSKLLVAPLADNWAMHSVAPVKGGFLITEVCGPDWRLQYFDADGGFIRTVGLPKTGIGIGSIASSAHSDHALITYSGWKIPSRWLEYNAALDIMRVVFEVRPAADYSQVVTYRLDATSNDGTKVPVTVIAMQGVTPDGSRPTILYGYGGFGICTVPRFLGSTLAWLERGGVYAVANIRGGGEFGEGWHEAGMLG